MFATSLALLASAYQRTGPRHRVRASGARRRAPRSRSARWWAACSSRRSAGRRSSSSTCRSAIAAVALTLAAGRGVQGPRRRAALDWPGTVTFSGALFALDLRPHPRQRRGLGQPADRRRCWPARSCCWSRFVLVGARARAHPMLDLSLFRKPDVRRRLDRGVRAVGVDVRDVPLPHALHPEHPRLLARSSPACASCR